MVLVIDNLYNELIDLKYKEKLHNGSNFETYVINKGARDIFRVALADALSEKLSDYEAKIATLEAKVFAYEAIIANSNFKPILTDQYKGSDPDKEV